MILLFVSQPNPNRKDTQRLILSSRDSIVTTSPEMRPTFRHRNNPNQILGYYGLRLILLDPYDDVMISPVYVQQYVSSEGDIRVCLMIRCRLTYPCEDPMGDATKYGLENLFNAVFSYNDCFFIYILIKMYNAPTGAPFSERCIKCIMIILITSGRFKRTDLFRV
jgi:hypothetical protein